MRTDSTFVSCNSVHGELDLMGGITHSCNDVMMQLSDRIGITSFTKMQKLFGLGQLTGIDLPGEASCAGTIYTADNMGPVEMWTSSFGQGYNATMVQVVSAFCSIVNGGYYYKPHVVSEIASDNGNTVQVFDKTLMRTTVSKTTSEWMKNALYETVEDGTGKAAQVAGYKIAARQVQLRSFLEAAKNVLCPLLAQHRLMIRSWLSMWLSMRPMQRIRGRAPLPPQLQVIYSLRHYHICRSSRRKK